MNVLQGIDCLTGETKLERGRKRGRFGRMVMKRIFSLYLSLSLLEYLYITNEAIDFDAYRDLCPKDFHGLVLIQSTGGQQGFGGGVVKSFGLLSLLLLLLHIGKRNDR